MAQTNFTPILTYKSDTATSVPSASNLTNSTNGAELAVNTADKRLFTKDSGGNVVEVGTNPSSMTLPNGSANGVLYLNGSKVVTTGSALTFDGATLGLTSSAVTSASVNSTNANGSAFIFKNSGTSVGWVGNGSSSFVGASASDFGINGQTNLIFGASGYEGMRLTSTGLGIGTSSPSAKLNVVGSGDMSGIFESTGTSNAASVIIRSGNATTSGLYAYARFVNNDSNAQDWRIGTYGTNNLSIVNAKASTTPVVLDTSGNLGLGVTPSGWNGVNWVGIDIKNATGGAGLSTLYPFVAANAYNAGAGWIYKTTAAASYYQQGVGSHSWHTAPSGTAGDAISFTQAMTLDASGNLGIGTSSPAQKLHVVGDGNFARASATDTYIQASNSVATFNITQSANGSTYLYNYGAYNLYFGTGSATKMTLDASGNLGLGVTPSAWDTSAVRALQIGAQAAFAAESSVAHVLTNAYYNAGWKYIGTGYATDYYQLDGAHVWRTAASGTAGNAITFTQAMTLDASGNLVVGGTSALGTTSGRGNITVNGTSSILSFGISGSLAGYVLHDGTDLWINNAGAGAQRFYTNGSERARIDSSGNLLVGTTTSNAQLTLSKDYGGGTAISMNATSSGAYTGILFSQAGTTVGYVSVGTSSTSYVTSSDYRLKNTIAPMTGALAKVALLKPCTYKWNADGSNSQGFIAHELAEVVPECVVGEKDAVDEDGNPKYQGIDTSFLVATLTAAIQEQQAIIDSLKARLDAANL